MKATKITLILLTTFCFIGCSVTTLTYMPVGRTNFLGIDLVKYADEGFLITPMGYNGEYITRGIYEVEVVPDSKVLNNGFIATPKFAEEYSPPEGFEKLLVRHVDGNYWILGIEKVDMSKVVNEAYEFAKSIGGDAIMLFNSFQNFKTGYYKSNQFEYTTKSVSGVVIKRD